MPPQCPRSSCQTKYNIMNFLTVPSAVSYWGLATLGSTQILVGCERFPNCSNLDIMTSGLPAMQIHIKWDFLVLEIPVEGVDGAAKLWRHNVRKERRVARAAPEQQSGWGFIDKGSSGLRPTCLGAAHSSPCSDTHDFTTSQYYRFFTWLGQ